MAGELQHGMVWWTELMTRKPDGARAFYKGLLDLKPFVASMSDMSRTAKKGEPSYTMFMKDDAPACGCMTLQSPDQDGVPPNWFTYFAVDDVDKSIVKVKKLGGKLLHGPFDVPGVGRIAIISDTEGVAFGIGTPAAMSQPKSKPVAKQSAAKAAPARSAGKSAATRKGSGSR